MRSFLLGILLCSTMQLHGKIYDCFPIFNELDLLECRLEELYDHVDYFIISESSETFQGNPKPLYFLENKVRFSKYLDKIRHVISDPLPPTVNTWARERHQRCAVYQALYDVEDNDILLIMDADEIVRAEKLPEITAHLHDNKNEQSVLFLSLYGATQFINSTYGQWVKAYATLWKTVKTQNVDHIRINCQDFMNVDNILKNAGWHFSSLGGLQNWRTKFESFSHREANTEENKSAACYFHTLRGKKVLEIDETFPQYIQDHRIELEEKGYILTHQQAADYGLQWHPSN